jgi:hypothetical protein
VKPSHLAIILIVLSLGGCKASQWDKKNHDKESTPNTMIVPQRVGTADATSSPEVTFELDAETGRIKSLLVLRLDYFPDPKAGSATLPACFSPLENSFLVGMAECRTDPELKAQIMAAHVDQDCYTNPDFKRRVSSTPISLPGCTEATAVTYAFEPGLRLDVELR